jgi:hypothetical protein
MKRAVVRVRGTSSFNFLCFAARSISDSKYPLLLGYMNNSFQKTDWLLFSQIYYLFNRNYFVTTCPVLILVIIGKQTFVTLHCNSKEKGEFRQLSIKSTIFWDITPYSPLKVNWCFGAAFMLVFCSTYSSALKMEAICFSETSVDFWRTTWCYIPGDSTLHNHCCENLKSYLLISYTIVIYLLLGSVVL